MILKRIRFFEFFLLFFAIFFSFSENYISNPDSSQNLLREKLLLKKENAKFSTVLSGKALCPPQETSYGFCILTDAKTLTAISSSGKILWEKIVQGVPEPYLTVLNDDFILQVSGKKILNFINPSGKQIWKKVLPFNILEKPFCGRDGRIFVRGKKNIACLGLNGILKWKVQTNEQSEIFPQELNDGTILFFLKEIENGCSKAIRVSPFGEIIATFTFSGIVKSAFSCDEGVLLSFENGGLGLCSVEDNSTITKWAHASSENIFFNTKNYKSATFIPLSKTKTALALPYITGTRFIFFENKTGNLTSIFETSEIDITQKTYAGKTENEEGLFVSDKKNAIIFTPTGRILYSVSLPENQNGKKWNYISCSSKNTLLLCETSWLFMGWKTLQSSPSAKKFKTQNKKDYSSFYTINTKIFDDYANNFSKIETKYADSARENLLLEGNYGILEENWASIILSSYKSYYNFNFQKTSKSSRSQQNIFEIDAKGTQTLINQLALLGTNDFNKEISKLLSVSDDYSKTTLLVRACKIFPYDPDFLILNQLEKIVLKSPVSNSTLLEEIADAVFEICNFMGRRALYSHGKEILTTLLFPKYDIKVREKARKNLFKIANSGI